MILKENEVLRCPRCGGKTFCATAHVTQDWELDDSGTFVRCLNDCIEVTHEPTGKTSGTARPAVIAMPARSS